MELTLYTAPMSRGEMVEWLLKELESPSHTDPGLGVWRA